MKEAQERLEDAEQTLVDLQERVENAEVNGSPSAQLKGSSPLCGGGPRGRIRGVWERGLRLCRRGWVGGGTGEKGRARARALHGGHHGAKKSINHADLPRYPSRHRCGTRVTKWCCADSMAKWLSSTCSSGHGAS